MIGLGAIGVTLTYSILRFANFAHGEFIAWGAYFALAVAGALGAMFGALLAPIGPFSFGWALPIARARRHRADRRPGACCVDALLFGRLRDRKSTVIIMVMASFGAALTLRSLLEFIFTSKPAYYTQALQIALPLGGGIRATPDQLLSLGVAAVLVVAVHLLLTRTAIGRSMRAVSENPQLAGVVGIEVRQGDPRRLAARRRRSPASPASAPGCSCRSARRWASTCCCRCLPPRSSAASAACRAPCSPA